MLYLKETVIHICGYGLPVINCIQLKTKKDISPIVEYLFDVYNMCVHSIVFELCVRKKEERKKKKE